MKYDIDLFERLNEEYRTHPVYDTAGVTARRQMLGPDGHNRSEISHEDRVRYAGESQLKSILRDVSVDGRVVLDLGCGHGYMAAALVEHAGAARAIGVDIKPNPSWEDHADPRLSLIAGDLSVEPVVPPDSVDLIVSQVVLEHVARPVQMLAAIYDTLKVGGAAWLRMNLFAARNASHAYKEVFFPWPHLLFDDEVVAQFYGRNHNRPWRTFSWVNRMTVAHYLQVCREVEFDIISAHRKVTAIDIPFYLRFEDKLGRYGALDLETDFLTLVLTKGTDLAAQTEITVSRVNYLARQRYLDRRIAKHLATRNDSPAGLSSISSAQAKGTTQCSPSVETRSLPIQTDGVASQNTIV